LKKPPKRADWKAIRRDVLASIQSGALKPGDLLPREIELAEKYDCTRSTVGRAMRDLAAAGFLERKRKGGTTVSANPVRKAPLEVPIIRSAIRAMGKMPSYRLIDFKTNVTDPKMAACLGLDSDEKLIFVESLYLADDKPFQVEQRWLFPGAVHDLSEADIQDTPLDEWLLENAPLTRANIEITAVTAPHYVAEVLEMDPRSPSLLITRISWSQDNPIGVLRLYHGPSGKLHSAI
jgi:GntR family histidine utilization transcriptional repressor